MKRYVCLALLCILFTTLRAQSLPENLYRATVITTNGQRSTGILLRVTDESVFLGKAQADSVVLLFSGVIPLQNIRRVVLRRQRRRGPDGLAGAVVGGIGFGLLTLRQMNRDGITDVSFVAARVAVATVGGAALGYVLGRALSALGRVVGPRLRVEPREGDVATLPKRLAPFSYDYQRGLMHRNEPLPYP